MSDGEVEGEADDVDSGPFCRHWGDPTDCNEPCLTCDHKCRQHDRYDDDAACDVTGCPCAKFTDLPSGERP